MVANLIYDPITECNPSLSIVSVSNVNVAVIFKLIDWIVLMIKYNKKCITKIAIYGSIIYCLLLINCGVNVYYVENNYTKMRGNQVFIVYYSILTIVINILYVFIVNKTTLRKAMRCKRKLSGSTSGSIGHVKTASMSNIPTN